MTEGASASSFSDPGPPRGGAERVINYVNESTLSLDSFERGFKWGMMLSGLFGKNTSKYTF